MNNGEIFISIIIPLAVDENKTEGLKKFLDSLAIKKNPFIKIQTEIIWMQSKTPTSRAKIMNQGVKKAKGNYLWFLHADSQLNNFAFDRLIDTIQTNPYDLIYFDLAFDSTDLRMKINSFGANLRSKLLRLPFGDQGFCIDKNLFKQLKGYPENADYGEDHLLVWKAKYQGLKIISTQAKLITSARKYQKNGWLKTTLLHQYLWLKQVLFALSHQDKL